MIPIEFKTGDYRTHGLHIMLHRIVDYYACDTQESIIHTDDGREHRVRHSPSEITNKICAASKELGGLKL